MSSLQRAASNPRVFGSGARTPTTPHYGSLGHGAGPSSGSPAAPSPGSPPNDTPTRDQYTSLSSLMDSPGSPKGKQRQRNTSGWRLPISQGGRDTGIGSGSALASPLPLPKKVPTHLSLWQLLALTVAMGGSQIVWTVELGYGTPYLLELGLSEEHTSLVWLAGPISGLVVQPLIGAISDSSTSRYRRRFWVVASSALLVISLLGLAYTEPVARAIVDLFGGGQGDWDPKYQAMAKQAAIAIAVVCFYLLDFALNGLQASLRNLVFDVTPTDQLNTANAWNGRFNHIGNIVGFYMGYMNLNGVPIFKWIGGDQFRKLSVVSLIILVITVWITCAFVQEDERPTLFGERRNSKLRDMINTIHEAVLNLPKPVRRICMVQIAAFMGWFPFLFYATTYVENVMSHELGHEADRDEATRAGSFALLIYSFVATFAGTVLPYLAERDQRLLPSEGEEEENEDPDDEQARVRDQVRQWKADVDRQGRELKLPRMPFMLRNVWTAALILFFLLMMSTFFIVNVTQATVMISLVGICWAVACWVPFAMIMEFLKELEAGNNSRAASNRPSDDLGSSWHSQPGSPRPAGGQGQSSERRPLMMRSYSTADLEGASAEYIGQGPVAGGTIMGIHNLAIVLPQFIIALVASVIFKLADGDKEVQNAGSLLLFGDGDSGSPGSGGGGGTAPYVDKTGVAWVLRFGGVMALVGAAICRRVPPTRTEKVMRRRLAEMREAAGE